MSLKPRNYKSATCIAVALTAAMIAFTQTSGYVVGQQPQNSGIGGFQVPRGTVPSTPIRPPTGPNPEQQWTSSQDQQPLATFVEPTMGSDADFEIIVGQGRLLPLRNPIDTQLGARAIAIGDPTVIDFEILPNPQLIRVIGRRVGVTDLSVVAANGQAYSFTIHVLYDIPLLEARLFQVFPSAQLNLRQMREHLIVEGQARNTAQVSQILQLLGSFLASVQVPHTIETRQPTDEEADGPPTQPRGEEPSPGEGERDPEAGYEPGRPTTSATFQQPQVINLIRVPGIQQVLLKVRIAELNRTGLRQIGADILGIDPSTGNIFGSAIGGAGIEARGTLLQGSAELIGGASDTTTIATSVGGGLSGVVDSVTGPATTAFGIFPSGDFEIFLQALRRNSLFTVLAEPNLVAMHGHEANFLAGGEFPVPVPQGGGGITSNVTIQFKEFGVRLQFIPHIIDDETIRLSVSPEVSQIDFSVGTTLVAGGTVVPGVATRRTTTTVQMKQGQTLTIAGLLNVEINGNTQRIPGLGDLPYIGPFFSNTSHQRIEKELVVLITPYLVEPLEYDEVPPLPTDHVTDPNDAEFYLLNRIEGRLGRPFRSTTVWDGPCCQPDEVMAIESELMNGPAGFSECKY